VSDKLDPKKGNSFPAAADTSLILDAGAAIGEAKENDDPDGRAYVVIPEGWKIERPPLVALPERAQGTAKLRDVPSFVAYFNAHKRPDSRIYASLTPARFLAVLDDYAQDKGDEHHCAAWREWRAEFSIPPSVEWTAWTKANKKQMSQVEFAEFIQDNAPDVADPPSGSLMEMALNFQSAENGSLVSATRLANGDTTFAIKTESTIASNIKMPEYLKLSIPVFENGDLYELRARMRYRARDSLVFWYELERPHKVLEKAFRDAWATIAEDTGCSVLLGTPE
jgi:uncharacterized protein YfdQ (DUF2303 family)